MSDNRNKAILIVDDASINRDILKEIFKDNYEILEAEDGVKAMKLIEERSRDIAVVLLDLFMPNKNGYDVLDFMNFNRYLRDIPVILISAEDSPEAEETALEYGAIDYIRKPFYLNVVKRRVERTIQINEDSKGLESIIDGQTKQIEEFSDSILNVFSLIMQYKNKNAKKSIRRVYLYTRKLLERLYESSDNYYGLTPSKISVISMASTVRDIGELTMDDRIVQNKQNLSPEDAAIYQQHTIRGCEILKAMANQRNKMFIKYALEVCRYHHEKWDGSGYPYGLSGDEIPISAQIVSVADTYECLRMGELNGRSYPHDHTISAITKGEFGVFSPELMECMKLIEEGIEEIFETV